MGRLINHGRWLFSTTPSTQFGIFGGGYQSSTLAVTDKYIFSNGTDSSGINLSFALDGVHAAGNTSFGIFTGTEASSHTAKYTYAPESSTTGTALLIGANNRGAATANSSFGIFVNSNSLATNKYTFSSDAVTAATALTGTAIDRGAAGTATIGIFSNSTPNTGTSKYTYSGDTTAVATSLGNVHNAGMAAGNTSVAIFAGGANGNVVTTATDEYTYSGDTVSAGSSISINGGLGGWNAAATGNAIVGIFGAGSNPTNYVMQNVTDVYTYSGNTVSPGTSLITPRYDLGAISSAPGGI